VLFQKWGAGNYFQQNGNLFLGILESQWWVTSRLIVSDSFETFILRD